MTEFIRPIYAGVPENFHWVGFGSGSGTNLRECAKVIPPAFVFSDKPSAKLFSLEELAHVPHDSLNGFKACGSWKEAQGNPEKEAEYQRRSVLYNRQILDLLHHVEDRQGAPIDLIVLGGYMRFVGEEIINAYQDKIINVHPADLSVLSNESNGKRARILVGEDAVYDAIKLEYMVTRSSVILVDGAVDHGEILTQGPLVNVWEEFLRGESAERDECKRTYADAHQKFQKVRSDWPSLTKALKLIAEGRLGLGTEKSHFSEWRTVYLDGKAQPYEGVQVRK